MAISAIFRVPQGFTPRPILDVIKRDFSSLSSFPYKFPLNILDSTALTNVTITTLKNLPLIFRMRPVELKDWSEVILGRLRYLETGFLSVASFVHNFVCATIFSAFTVLTLGQIIKVRELCEKYLLHTVLAVGSSFTCIAGVVSPRAGAITNMALWGLSIAAVYKITGAQLIRSVNDYYNRNREQLKIAMRESVNNNDQIYNLQIDPIFTYFDRHLVDESAEISDLQKLFTVFSTAFERHAILYGITGGLAKEVLTTSGVAVLEDLRAQVERVIPHIEASAARARARASAGV